MCRNLCGKIKVKSNEFLPLFFLIFCSIDTLLFGININYTVKILGSVVICIIALILLIKSRLLIKSNYLKLAFSLSILTVITMVFNSEIGFKYFYVILLIWAACFYVNVYSKKDFILQYCSIIYFLSVCSVLLFLVYMIAPGLIFRLPKLVSSINYTYYHAFFSTVMEKVVGMGYRNYGIFREPGVYACLILFALIFELFMKKESNTKHIFFDFVALAITFSTTGYIILFLLVAYYVISNQSYISKGRNLKLLLIILFIVSIFYLIVFGQMGAVFGKLFVANASKNSRFDAIAINIKMLFDRIAYAFIGNGFIYTETNFPIVAKEIGSVATDNTNTIFRIIVTQGILYASIVISKWWLFFKKSAGAKRAIILLGLYILILFTENLMLNPVMFIMVFYGTETLNKGRNNENI